MADQATEFTACWNREVGRVSAYARRHVGVQEAQEVVAETFLQAWRRWPRVPDPALPWLLGTARRVIANHRRGTARRIALHQRIALLDAAARPATDAMLGVDERLEALRALASLTEPQREAILLTAWDGLSVEQAARVVRVRPGTMRGRLHRARSTLMSNPRAPLGHTVQRSAQGAS